MQAFTVKIIKRVGNNTIFLFLIGIIIATTLNSCEINDNESYKTCDDIKSKTSSFTKLKLNVKYDRVNYNHSQVTVSYTNYYTTTYEMWGGGKQVSWWTGVFIDGSTKKIDRSFIVAEAGGINPTLTFKDVPDEYLTNILYRTDTYGGFGNILGVYGYGGYSENPSISISNENAKVAVVKTILTTGTGYSHIIEGGFTTSEPVHMFIDDDDVIGYSAGILVYCNTDCDITGTITDGYVDIRLRKGWNKIFEISCDGKTKIITWDTDNLYFYCIAG